MDAVSDFRAGYTAEGPLRNPQGPYQVFTVGTTDGAQIHVRAYGPKNAPAVVFVHGFACRLEYWNPQINSLSSRYRVIAYDQRGLGRSTMGSAGVRPDVLGDDLAAVLDATISPGRRAVVTGHSFGGITIMAWAQSHPEQVRSHASAVLLANTVADRFRANTAIMPFAGRYGFVRGPVLGAIMRSRAWLPERAPITRAVRSIAMSPQATLKQADFLRTMVAGVAIKTRVLWGSGLFDLDVRGGLEHLTVPCTVLVGSMDRLTPPTVARQIAAILRSHGRLPKFVEMVGIGHCSNIQASAEFDAEVIELLEMTRPRTTAND